MNPYAFNNLFKPVVLQDWRESEKHSHNVGLDYSMSRVFFRAVDSIGRVVLKRSS